MSEVKVGDRVLIHNRFGAAYTGEVVRLLRTQFVVKTASEREVKFYKVTMKQVGDASRWYPTEATMLDTEEGKQMYEEAKRKAKRSKMVKDLQTADWPSLGDENLLLAHAAMMMFFKEASPVE